MTPAVDLEPLSSAASGRVVGAGDEDWDEARQAWNLAADQDPAAVVLAESAADVQAAVRFAAANGLRVAAQATGHAAGMHETLEDTLLVKTARMAAVDVDPDTRVARFKAGTLSVDVAAATADHGLSALLGSSVDVGVTGFTVGGGLGWLARRYGFACNSVREAHVVTGAGEIVRADADTEPELFWALRGGGGAFGVVIELKVDLHPVAEVFAGDVMYDAEHAPSILRAYRDWARQAPPEVTSSVRFLTPPPLPEVPEAVRSRPLMTVTAAYAGDPAEGERLLAPIRDLAPVVMDSYAAQSAEGLCRIHGDPEQPVPGITCGAMLSELDDGAIEALVGIGGEGSPLLQIDLRHLGGALGEAPSDAGALCSLSGEFAVASVGVPMGPVTPDTIEQALDDLVRSLAPWATELSFLNFTDQPGDGSGSFSPEDYARLRAVKAATDPDQVIRGGQEVEPAH